MTAKKVFLIDDDPDDRAFFCEALEEIAADILCYSAVNGRKALSQIINKEIEIPDVIFLDINMPQMNGWQFLSMLKQYEPYEKVPVIMYSTSSHPEDVEKARQSGALCLFTKPNDFNTLKKALETVVVHLRCNSLSSLVLDSSLFLVS